ncbi:hypothetical protein CPB86DRAFT_161988 [Serendipita vermifera]|nr:hypothetical protein CPB86DRAFT_161988 [Serendipita vermifera]
MELDENRRQLFGSTKLKGRDLYKSIGKQFEVPLIGHESYPDLDLKAQVLHVENPGNPVSGRQQSTLSFGEDTIDRIHSESIAALDDLKRYGKIAGLEQTISQLEATIKAIPEDNLN